MNTKTCITAILLAVGFTSSHAQDTWTQKADFGGGARLGSVGFSIDSKGYLGTGSDLAGHYKDFWEYDPSTNAWTQKADLVGGERRGAVSFAINGKGYIGTGVDVNGRYFNDLWEYDPTSNSWTQRANFGGTARYNAVGFSVGSKGYIGTGFDSNGSVYKDFWEYDPATDTWTRVTDFGGAARYSAVGFCIGSKGYIGTGSNPAGNVYRDFWEYDPSTAGWTQKADFGGTARIGATGLSIGGKGYLGIGVDVSGAKKDFWEYDPITNVWTDKANFKGRGRYFAAGFSIGSKCYMGTGFTAFDSFFKDFWEYTPATAQTNPVPLINQPLVPDATAPGGPGFILTVNGTGFVSGSVVDWNGSVRATTFVSGSQLTATVLASDVAIASTASVTVVNPSPGGGISNVMAFSVTNATVSVAMQSSVIGTSSAETATAGDFNGDGKSDLAVVGRFSSRLSILLGNGDGSFQPRVEYEVGLFARWVITGDFNRDGKLDLAGGGDVSAQVSILLGQGDGTFQAPMLYATGAAPIWGVTADFNADGTLDLAVAGNGQVSILLGNGDGTFGSHLDYDVGEGYMWVGTGDFNADGTLDLAVGQWAAPNVFILLGNGDGTFQPHVDYPTGTNPRSLAVGDLNGDGKLDLAVAADSSSQVSILLGNGDGTFQSHVDYAAVIAPTWISLGDFNGDGTVDLALSSFADPRTQAVIILGNGDGTFQPPLSYPTHGGRGESGTVADFDGDGRLDLAVANSDSSTVSVLLQIPTGNLNLLSAASVKGSFAIDLPLTGPSGVEDRSGGPNKKYTVVMTFDQNIVSVGSVSSTCGSVQSIVLDSSDPHKVNINLVNVAHGCNGSTITVTADSITDDQGNVLGSASVALGLLLGDVNADRVVNRGDTNEAQMHKGQKAVQENFRSDVNASGHIERSDIQLIRQQQGTSLP